MILTCFLQALEFGWEMAKKVQLYLKDRKEPLFTDGKLSNLHHRERIFFVLM
jgi:hypothetical protein